MKESYRTGKDTINYWSFPTSNFTTQFLLHLTAGMTLIIAASIAVLAIAFRPPRLIYPPYPSPNVCSKPTLELSGDHRVRCLLAVEVHTRKS